MNTQTAIRSVRESLLRGAHLLAALVVATMAIMSAFQNVAHAATDTYPDPWRAPTAQDSMFDNWREYNRECTSYVAWMLHSVNGFEMPFYDNAAGWGPDATAKNYTVDAKPAVGSVYWVQSPEHVAWVESVSANGTQVTIEDYNSDFQGNWGESTVATSSASGYIHFKDLAVDKFSQVSRSTSSIDALDRNAAGSLIDEWWDASLGWHQQTITDASGQMAPASDPKVISRGANSMNAFYRDVNNRLDDEWWNNDGTGWHNQVPSGGSGMAGEASPISRSTNSMDVLYRNTSSQPVDEWWDASVGWNNYVIYGTPVVAGNPKAFSRTATSMDVIYRASDDQLVDMWWDASSGWHYFVLPGTTGTNGVAGDPTVISRSSATMDVLYRSKANQLVDEWWDANAGGWHNYIIYGTPLVDGNPSAINRSATNVDVLFKDPSKNLIDTWWDASSGWHSSTLPNISGPNVSGDPTPVARTSTTMDVLYRNTSTGISDEWWDASSGWHPYNIN